MVNPKDGPTWDDLEANLSQELEDVLATDFVNYTLEESYKTINFDSVSGTRGPPQKVMKDGPGRARKHLHLSRIKPTVEKVALRQRRQSTWVTYCSPEYCKFIQSLSDSEHRHLPICMTCWRYVTTF